MFSRIPLTALRAFEAAARTGGFKSAAEELSVTPAAVSHQVKSLETWLGLRLFERGGQGVRLTTSGEQLFRDAHRAMLDLSRSLDRLMPQQPSAATLTLTTIPSLAAQWLIPRLGSFHRAWPQVDLRVDTREDLVDLTRDASFDLAVRTVSRDDPRLHTVDLMQEHFAVYGAPRLFEADPDASIELINLRWQLPGPWVVDWKRWCAAAGLQGWLERARLREYDDEHHALSAALAGHGWVLASNVLVADAVARGQLRPYRPDVHLDGPRYVAVCVPGRERESPVREFLDWLLAQAADTPLA